MESRNKSKVRCPNRVGVVFALGALVSAATARFDEPAEDPVETVVVLDPSIEDSEDELDELALDTAEESFDLLFEDFEIVVSASRSEQTLAQTSVPVSVISDKVIRLSGVAEIPDILHTVPGVDVFRLDNNRWSIGVRGLHQTFSDRTLFLVNGQNASSALHGGIDFQRLPLFLEDIAQIEVVRGPGGGAWGANAYNGVINVIEKSPSETQGVLFSYRIDEHGSQNGVFRFGFQNDKGFAARITGELIDVDASGAFYENSGTTVAPVISNDFNRNRKFGFDAIFGEGSGSEVEVSIGHAHVERGDAPFLNLQLGVDERIDYNNWSVKLDRELDSDRRLTLQWYGAHEDVNRPSMYRFSSLDNTLDAQYEFVPGEDHQMTLGVVGRLVQIDIESALVTDSLPAGVFDEQWVGAFVNDRWSINDRWSFEGQARVDWYSETETDWAGRLALIHDVAGDGKHTLRLAAARSFRTPQIALRELVSERLPLPSPPAPPGLFGLNIVPARDLKNEQLYAIELGYTGKLTDEITLRSDMYVQHYENLTGSVQLPEPAPVLGRNFFTIANVGDASAFGVETELIYETDRYRLSGWYAYNSFHTEIAGQGTRAFLPAKNKAGVSMIAELTDALSASAHYRYTDITPSNFAPAVEGSHRVDLILTYDLPKWHAEFQVGVHDLLDDTALVINDQTATGIGQESRGRSAFFRIRMEF
jgi:outer membrane receptor protein involved in Fe transport